MARKPEDEELERLLGGKRWLGVSRRDAVLEQVLARTSPRPKVRLWAALAAGLGVAATAVLLMLFRPTPEPEFATRGSTLRPSFTFSCVEDGHPAPCTRGASVVFDVRPAGFGAFGAVMETPDGATVWIFPSGARSESIDLHALGEHGVLPEGLKLEGPAGGYVIHAVFSQAPLNKDALRRALQDPASTDVFTQSQRLELP